MANGMLTENEEEKTELNGTAGEALDTARNTANAATENAVGQPSAQPVQVTSKPTFSEKEMRDQYGNGTSYSDADFDAMTTEQRMLWMDIARENNGHPRSWSEVEAENARRKAVRDAAREKERRYELMDTLEKKASFVVDHTADDPEMKSVHDDMASALGDIRKNLTAFVNASDEELKPLEAGIEQRYQEATKRLGHMEHMWNQLKRGCASMGNMIYQGMKTTAPGEMTEEDAALIRGSMMAEKDNRIENPQKIGDFGNIKSAGDLLDYLSDTVVQNVPRAVASTGLAMAGATAMPYHPVAGSILFCTLGTMWMNTGEAVQDILDEQRGGEDADIRNSRNYALLQGGIYSVFDGAFGVSMMASKLWGSMIRKAGIETVRDAAKGAGVEWAKDTFGKSTIRGALKDVAVHGVLGEGIQEAGQSQIGGRFARWLETGSLFKRNEDGTYETPKEAWWEAANEFVGGAASGVTFGLLGGGAAHIDARRTVGRHVNNVMSVLKNDPRFNEMDDYAKLLVSKHLENEGFLSTTHLFDQRYLKALEKCNEDIDAEIDRLSKLEGKGNERARMSGQTARAYLDIFKSQYDLRSLDDVIVARDGQAGKRTCSDGQSYTPNIDVDGMRNNYEDTVEYVTNKNTGEKMPYRRLRVFTNPREGSKMRVVQVLDAEGNPTGKHIFDNDPNFKSPIFGDDELVCDNLGAALEKACDLDVYNQWRANRMKSKAQLANQVFDHLFGKRGFTLNLVDRPTAGKSANASTIAGVNAETRVVDLDLSKINNLGKLYTTLMHERSHADIIDFLLQSDKWVNKVGVMTDVDWLAFDNDREALFAKVQDENGVSAEDMRAAVARKSPGSDWAKSAGRTGEEMVVERNSVRKLATDIRKADRGIVGSVRDRAYGLALDILNRRKATPGSLLDRVRQTVAQKMALDMGLDPMSLMTDLDANTSEEMAKIFDTGYMGKEAEGFSRQQANVPEPEGRGEVRDFGMTMPGVNPAKDTVTVGSVNTTETGETPNPRGRRVPKNLKPAMANGEGSSVATGTDIQRADGTIFTKNDAGWTQIGSDASVDDSTATEGGYRVVGKKSEGAKTAAEASEKKPEKTDTEVTKSKKTEKEEPKKADSAGRVEKAEKTDAETPSKAESTERTPENAKDPEGVSARPEKNDENKDADKSKTPEKQKNETGKVEEPKDSVRSDAHETVTVEQNKTPAVSGSTEKDTVTINQEPEPKDEKPKRRGRPKKTQDEKTGMPVDVKKRVLTYNGLNATAKVPEGVESLWMRMNELPVGSTVTFGGKTYTRVDGGKNDAKDHAWADKTGKKTTQFRLATQASLKANVEMHAPESAQSASEPVTVSNDVVRTETTEEKPRQDAKETAKAEPEVKPEADEKKDEQPFEASEKDDTIKFRELDRMLDESFETDFGFLNDAQRASVKALAHTYGEPDEIIESPVKNGIVKIVFGNHEEYVGRDGKSPTISQSLAKTESDPGRGESSARVAHKTLLDLTQESLGSIRLGTVLDEDLGGNASKYTGLSDDKLLALSSRKDDVMAYAILFDRFKRRFSKWFEDQYGKSGEKYEKNDIDALVRKAEKELKSILHESDTREVSLLEAMRSKARIEGLALELELAGRKASGDADYDRESVIKAIRSQMAFYTDRLGTPLSRTVRADSLFYGIANSLWNEKVIADYYKKRGEEYTALKEMSEKLVREKEAEAKALVEKMKTKAANEAAFSGREYADVLRDMLVSEYHGFPDWYRNFTVGELCVRSVSDPMARSALRVKMGELMLEKGKDTSGNKIETILRDKKLGVSHAGEIYDRVLDEIESQWKNGGKNKSGKYVKIWQNGNATEDDLRNFLTAVIRLKVDQLPDSNARETGNALGASSYEEIDKDNWSDEGDRNDDDFSPSDDSSSPFEIGKSNDVPGKDIQGDPIAVAEYMLASDALTKGQSRILRALVDAWKTLIDETYVAKEEAKARNAHKNTLNSKETNYNKALRAGFIDGENNLDDGFANAVEIMAAESAGMKRLVYRSRLNRLMNEIGAALIDARREEASNRKRTLDERKFKEKVFAGRIGRIAIDNSLRTVRSGGLADAMGYNAQMLMDDMAFNGDDLMLSCVHLALQGKSDGEIQKIIDRPEMASVRNSDGTKKAETLLKHAYELYGWIDTRLGGKKSLTNLVEKVLDTYTRLSQLVGDRVEFVNTWFASNGVKADDKDIYRAVLEVSSKKIVTIPKRKTSSQTKDRAYYAEQKLRDFEEVDKIFENDDVSTARAKEILKERGYSDRRIKDMMRHYVEVSYENDDAESAEPSQPAVRVRKMTDEEKRANAEMAKALNPYEKHDLLRNEIEKRNADGSPLKTKEQILEYAASIGLSKASANRMLGAMRPTSSAMTEEELKARNERLDAERGTMRRINEEELAALHAENEADRAAMKAEEEARAKKVSESSQKLRKTADVVQSAIDRVGYDNLRQELVRILKAEKDSQALSKIIVDSSVKNYSDRYFETRADEMIGAWSEVNRDKLNAAKSRNKTEGIFTGSTADYKKPSLVYVGSGEGSQVYGWGLYGSNKRGVSEVYSKLKSIDSVLINGKSYKDLDSEISRLEERRKHYHEIVLSLLTEGKSSDYYAKNIDIEFSDEDEERLENLKIERDVLRFVVSSGSVKEAISYLENKQKEEYEKYGLKDLYEKEIDFLRTNKNDITVKDQRSFVYEQTFFTNRAEGDESHLLSWYEPITRDNQARIIRQMRKEGVANPYDNGKGGRMFVAGAVDWRTATNGEVYDNLVTKLGSPKAASEFLARADIDGIKYPVDSYGGKTIKDGDKVGWNYVSFRDDNITVDHKWVDGVQRFKTDVSPDEQIGKSSLAPVKKFYVRVFEDDGHELQEHHIIARSAREAEKAVEDELSKNGYGKKAETFYYSSGLLHDTISANDTGRDKTGASGGELLAGNRASRAGERAADAGGVEYTPVSRTGVERKGSSTGQPGDVRHGGGRIQVEPEDPGLAQQFRDGIRPSEWSYKTDVATDDQRGKFRPLNDTSAVSGTRENMNAHGHLERNDVSRKSKSNLILMRQAKHLMESPDRLMKTVMRANDGGQITDIEILAMTMKRAELIAKGIDGNLTADEFERNEEAIDLLTHATLRGGRAIARALNALKLAVDLRQRDSLVYMQANLRSLLEKDDERRYGALAAQSAEKLKEREARIEELTKRMKEQEAEMARLHDVIDKNTAEMARKTKEAEERDILADNEKWRKIGFDEGRKAASEEAREKRLAELDSAVGKYNADKYVFAKVSSLIGSLADLYGDSTRFAGDPTSTLDDRKRTAFAAAIAAFKGDVENARRFLADKFVGFHEKMESDFDAFVAEQDKANRTAGLTEGAKTRKRKESTLKIAEKAAEKEPSGGSASFERGSIEKRLMDRISKADLLAKNAADPEIALQEIGESARAFMKLFMITNPEASFESIYKKLIEHMNAIKTPFGFSFTEEDVRSALLGKGDFTMPSKSRTKATLESLLKAEELARAAGDDRAKLAEATKVAGIEYNSDAELVQELERRIGNDLNNKLDVLESRINEDEKSNEGLMNQIHDLISALHDIRAGRKSVDQLLVSYLHLASGMSAYRRQKSVLERIRSRIALYQKRLDNDDFETPPKRTMPDTESEIREIQHATRSLESIRERFKNERKTWKIRRLPWAERHFGSIFEILGEIKAVVGSLDLSSVLRQGGQMSWAHPILAAKNIKRMFSIIRSDANAEKAFNSIWDRPNAKYYTLAGIDFTNYGSNAGNSEDLFLLNKYRWLTNNRFAKAGINASERAFTMFLNLMRADVFDAMVANSPFRDASNMSVEQLKALGNYINIASQRGSFNSESEWASKLKDALPMMNALLWSPRNIVSRIQFIGNTLKLLAPGFKAYGTTDWAMRRMLAKETGRYFLGVGAAIAFTKLMADLFRGDDEPPEDMVFDPRSSEFLQVKVGNTHLDFLSGLKPLVVFSSRLATGTAVNSRGQERKNNAMESLGKLLRSKFAPASGIVWDWYGGETFDRQDIVYSSPFKWTNEEIGIASFIFGQVAPLSLRDMYEQFDNNGFVRGILTTVYAMLGAGANTYDPNTYKQLKGDYHYYRRLLQDAATTEERAEIVRRHPMLKNAGAIEDHIRRVNSIERNIREAEKRGVSTKNLEDMRDRARKQGINLMTGVRNPMDVQ